MTTSHINGLVMQTYDKELLLRMQNAERGGQHYNSQVIEQIRAATQHRKAWKNWKVANIESTSLGNAKSSGARLKIHYQLIP